MPIYLISVVVPTHNYGSTISRALDSVILQGQNDVELIVVDDGSLDDTAKILADYKNRHSKIKVIHQKNAGAAAARNTGIREAAGQHVLLLDADDELLPGSLETLLSAQKKAPEAGIFLGGYISASSTGRETVRYPTPIPQAPRADLLQAYLLKKSIKIQHCSSMFRRDLLLARPYPEMLLKGEDIPVFAFLLANSRVVVLKQLIAKIHKHSDSLRHCRTDEETNAMAIVNEVFQGLPRDYDFFRNRYAAQQYLSLFRGAFLAGDKKSACSYYRKAMYLSPRQAIKWSYMAKFLRTLGI